MPLYVIPPQPMDDGDAALAGLGQGLQGYFGGKLEYDTNRRRNEIADRQTTADEGMLNLRQKEFDFSTQPQPIPQPTPQDVVGVAAEFQNAANSGVDPQLLNQQWMMLEQTYPIFGALAKESREASQQTPVAAQGNMRFSPKQTTSTGSPERFFNINTNQFSTDPSVLESGEAGWLPWTSSLSKFMESKVPSERFSELLVSDGSDGLPDGTVYQLGADGGYKEVFVPSGDKKEDWRNIATGLRKEFDANQAAKDFQTIQRSASQIRAAYKEAIKPVTNEKSRVASDQVLAVSFQKMLDPSSVVRESEYARTPEGVAMINKIESFIPQLEQGGLMIADIDRKAILDMADKLLTEAKRSMNNHIERYESLATQYDVPQSAIFGNIKKFNLTENKPVGPNPVSDGPVDPNLLSNWGLTP